MVIMGILNHFSLKLVNVGIIHQKLDEIVGKINNKEIVGKINNSIFNFFVTALLDATNHFFGLTTATDTVIISCDISKWTGTIDGFEIIHIMKWYYDYRKRNVPKNLKYAGLHVLAPFQLKEVSNILSDPGFEIIISILE